MFRLLKYFVKPIVSVSQRVLGYNPTYGRFAFLVPAHGYDHTYGVFAFQLRRCNFKEVVQAIVGDTFVDPTVARTPQSVLFV